MLPLSILIPIGAIALSLLVGYGLLEYIGVLMQPVMRPLFKTPGKSAVDAVASFVGSYSLGLLITNRVYKDGMYNKKEAVIIATGFSTVRYFHGDCGEYIRFNGALEFILLEYFSDYLRGYCYFGTLTADS